MFLSNLKPKKIVSFFLASLFFILLFGVSSTQSFACRRDNVKDISYNSSCDGIVTSCDGGRRPAFQAQIRGTFYTYNTGLTCSEGTWWDAACTRQTDADPCNNHCNGDGECSTSGTGICANGSLSAEQVCIGNERGNDPMYCQGYTCGYVCDGGLNECKVNYPGNGYIGNTNKAACDAACAVATATPIPEPTLSPPPPTDGYKCSSVPGGTTFEEICRECKKGGECKTNVNCCHREWSECIGGNKSCITLPGGTGSPPICSVGETQTCGEPTPPTTCNTPRPDWCTSDRSWSCDGRACSDNGSSAFCGSTASNGVLCAGGCCCQCGGTQCSIGSSHVDCSNVSLVNTKTGETVTGVQSGKPNVLSVEPGTLIRFKGDPWIGGLTGYKKYRIGLTSDGKNILDNQEICIDDVTYENNARISHLSYCDLRYPLITKNFSGKTIRVPDVGVDSSENGKEGVCDEPGVGQNYLYNCSCYEEGAKLGSCRAPAGVNGSGFYIDTPGTYMFNEDADNFACPPQESRGSPNCLIGINVETPRRKVAGKITHCGLPLKGAPITVEKNYPDPTISKGFLSGADGIFNAPTSVGDQEGYAVRAPLLSGFKAPKPTNTSALPYGGMTQYEFQHANHLHGGHGDCGENCNFEYEPICVAPPSQIFIQGAGIATKRAMTFKDFTQEAGAYTLSWNSAFGATGYAVRINEYSESDADQIGEKSWVDGQDCPAQTDANDICTDTTNLNYSFTMRPGKNYHIWIRSRDCFSRSCGSIDRWISYIPKGVHEPSVSCNLVGWACDLDIPNEPVEVTFFEGSQNIGSTMADMASQPAAQNECGGGARHNFSFPLPNNLRNGANHTISAFAMNYPERRPNPGLEDTPQQVVNCSSPAYRVGGTVFLDTNRDGLQQTGEPDYTAGGMTVSVGGASNTVTLNAGSGNFTFTNVLDNTIQKKVELDTGLTGYGMTHTPDQVNVGLGTEPNGCKLNFVSPPGRPGTCSGGNISGLKIGIATSPWIEGNSLDLRAGYKYNVPINKFTLLPSFASPSDLKTIGVVFGRTSSRLDFTPGGASQNNWIVAGAYTSPRNTASYDRLLSLAKKSGKTITKICEGVANCTYNITGREGIYHYEGTTPLTIIGNATGDNIITILSRGDVQFTQSIDVEYNSLLLLSTKGNITVTPSVIKIMGFLRAGGSATIQGASDCSAGIPDEPLLIEGSLVASTISVNRNKCGSNATEASLLLSPRLDFILNYPVYLSDQSTTLREIAP